MSQTTCSDGTRDRCAGGNRAIPAWSQRTARKLALASLSGVLAVAIFVPGAPCSASPGSATLTTSPPTPLDQPPKLPPAAIDNTLVIGGDDIKGREVDTRMTIDVGINGRGPFRFVVDSGADSSAIGQRVARFLQLRSATPVTLHGMAATTAVDRVVVDQLSFGLSSTRELQHPVLREGDLGADGMIGIDALVNQRLMLDFEKRIIKSEDARKPDHFSGYEIVVTARRQRGQLILTEVTAGTLPVEAVIDTGSEVTIGNLALRDRLVRKGRAQLATVSMTDVTGATVNLEMAIIRELKVGSITFEDVPIAFANVPPFDLFGLAGKPALLLGTDLLESFRRVSLDFRARKVRFQLRHCGSRGITISTSSEFWSTRLSGNSDEVCAR